MSKNQRRYTYYYDGESEIYDTKECRSLSMIEVADLLNQQADRIEELSNVNIKLVVENMYGKKPRVRIDANE